MKTFVFVAVALAVDVARREPPLRAAVVALAYGAAQVVSTLLKAIVDRPRPDGEHLVDLPSSSSLPSGHATSAFGAAVALGMLVPAARWPALALAAVIAYSRVYLGVHYWTDILAGAVIGAAVGWAVVALVRRRRSARPGPR